MNYPRELKTKIPFLDFGALYPVTMIPKRHLNFMEKKETKGATAYLSKQNTLI